MNENGGRVFNSITGWGLGRYGKKVIKLLKGFSALTWPDAQCGAVSDFN